jgi:hypothetical protein
MRGPFFGDDDGVFVLRDAAPEPAAAPCARWCRGITQTLQGEATRMGQCPGMPPDATWAETDELRVAERSNPQIKSYVPREAVEKGVKARAQP